MVVVFPVDEVVDAILKDLITVVVLIMSPENVGISLTNLIEALI